MIVETYSFKWSTNMRKYSLNVYSTLIVLCFLRNANHLCDGSTSTPFPEEGTNSTPSEYMEKQDTNNQPGVDYYNKFFNCTKRRIPEMKEPPSIVSATTNHTATIIFLHSIGDSGKRWAEALKVIKPKFMKLICPTGNPMVVVIKTGVSRVKAKTWNAWFNGHFANTLKDPEGVRDSIFYVHSLLDDEIKRGIPSERIMIGGFAQGGEIALHAALTYPHKLAGIMAISTKLDRPRYLPEDFEGENRYIPILHGRCSNDTDDVFHPVGYLSEKALEIIILEARYNYYEGFDYCIPQFEMPYMRAFIKERLPLINNTDRIIFERNTSVTVIYRGSKIMKPTIEPTID